jgi:hypothetical protein
MRMKKISIDKTIFGFLENFIPGYLCTGRIYNRKAVGLHYSTDILIFSPLNFVC